MSRAFLALAAAGSATLNLAAEVACKDGEACQGQDAGDATSMLARPYYQHGRPGKKPSRTYSYGHGPAPPSPPMGIVVDSSCQDGNGHCSGACFEGPLDYLRSCIAGEGPHAADNFVTNILMDLPVVKNQADVGSCADNGFGQEVNEDQGGTCPDGFYGNYNVCFFVNDEKWFEERAAGFADPSKNPYLSCSNGTGTPVNECWFRDYPQCRYRQPGTPIAPKSCPVEGRYNCPAEVCVNGTEIILDGTAQGDQPLVVTDRGHGYYLFEVLDNPFNVKWNATMYQKSWDPLSLTGAMYSVSNRKDWTKPPGQDAWEAPDQQYLEAHFDTPDCNFKMTLTAWTSIPYRAWETPFHMCNFTCIRELPAASP